MDGADRQNLEAKIEARYRTMRILWAALFAAVLLYALLGFIIHPPAETVTGGEGTTLLAALFAAGISLVIVSFFVKKAFLARAAAEQRVELVQTGYIVALTLCDGAALLGLLALFITLHTYSYLLFAVGAAGMLLHHPRREHLLAASYKK